MATDEEFFTYFAYRSILNGLSERGFRFETFKLDLPEGNIALIRHDIDSEIYLLNDIASLEHDLGLCSTYFLMLSSTAYNIFSLEAQTAIKRLKALGHSVGLHFQSEQSDELDDAELSQKIRHHCDILADASGYEVTAFSYHQPTQEILARELEVPGLVNAYGLRESAGITYTSDTNMEWRSGHPVDLADSGVQRLQILVHPMWWTESEVDMEYKWRRVRASLNDTVVRHWMARERSLETIDTSSWLD